MWGPMIFDTETLVFQTFLPGQKDPVTLKYVDGLVDQEISAIGDLQPYLPKGKEQVNLIDGFSLRNAFCFITSASLPTLDDVGSTKAAQTTIKGRTYFVMRDMDYSNGSMATDGHFYVLVQQDTAEGSV